MPMPLRLRSAEGLCCVCRRKTIARREEEGRAVQASLFGMSVCLSAYHYRVTIILCAVNNAPCLETVSRLGPDDHIES